MATPKVGGHAYIRERAIPKYTGHYGKIDKEQLFEVELISGGSGRDAIHLRDGSVTIPVWRGDVRAVPRCTPCDNEGHTQKQANKKNCAAISGD